MTLSKRSLPALLSLLALLVAALVVPSAHAQTSTTLAVDAGTRYQTVQGLGVNVNARSWDNGKLAPALDRLTDELGATAFRVVVDNADWEATNDDADPAHFNWDYYDQVYETPRFTDLWNTIAYLNTKKVTVALNVMGPSASWMGGPTLSPSKEDEWAEMMASLVYYGRVVKKLDFSLFEPFNEPDWNGVEGTQVTADQVVRVTHAIASRLDGVGLNDVRFILPDTANVGSGLGAYFTALQQDPYVMGKVAALGLHSYSGDTGNASSVIAGSSYPTLPFWMTEFSAPCNGCDTGAPNPRDWPFARSTAQDLLTMLRQGASGAEVWEGYDSYYAHHASWSYWGLLSYDQTVGTYAPRKSFYGMAQFMRFISPGAVRIGASSGSGNLPVVAFRDSSDRVTLVGLNTSSTPMTVNGTIAGVEGLSTLRYYQTNAAVDMANSVDVPVTGGAFATSVPPDTLFTLTGTAGPDTTPPTVSLTSPSQGATVAGVTQLVASAADDRGLARVEFSVDGQPVGSDDTAPYEQAWDARTVSPGAHRLTAEAFDRAGNHSAAGVDVQVVTDTSPPSPPSGLVASAPTTDKVSLTWDASTDDIAVADYRVLRDGTVVGTTRTPTYVDTSVVAGTTYTYTVVARDTSDNLSAPSAPVRVTVGNRVPLAVDTLVTTHQTAASGTISSPRFSTTTRNELLVAFAGSDGPTTASQSYSSVTGAGVTWKLRQRANGQAGSAEVWTAAAADTLTNAQVTATRARSGYVGSLTVVAFSGADTSVDGAAAGASAASGAPTVRLTTTADGSWVWGVGDDWDRAVARTLPAGQTLVDQYLASVGDTFWVQRHDAPTASAGTSVTVNDTAPTTDRWNLAAIEVRPAAPPVPDTTAPTATLTMPTEGATVSGTTTVAATASDNVAVTRTELLVDGTSIGTDTTAPYTFSWDTTKVADGSHSLVLAAYDAAGNTGSSPPVTVTVRNADSTAPTAPTGVTATAVSAGEVRLGWSASSDNVGVTGYSVMRDGVLLDTTTATTYRDTTVKPDTSYTYRVLARDAAGNVSPSSETVTVRTPALPPPDTTPPGVDITSPTDLATVSGPVSVAVAAADDIGVTAVELSVDGVLLATDSTAPYSFSWDSTGVVDGSHDLMATAYDAAGNHTSTTITVTVRNAVPLKVDTTVTTHQARKATSITSPSLSTSAAGDLLVAFAAADGPKTGAQAFASVTGAGVTWRLRQRADAQPGTAEIWTAVAPGSLTGVRVTAALSRGSYLGSLTVVAFKGADTVTDGAVAGASALNGAPSVSLTATKAGSQVWSVGDDWDNAVHRTVPAGQTLVDEFLASVGDTFWLQRVDAPTASAGARVTAYDTAPTTDRWNLAAIEVRAR
ncbi:MAG TPA: Ig-like domain-containing protein [Marmoricola sp.]|nr:Ig-like domain-containing protein [Marmoricola sp.]